MAKQKKVLTKRNRRRALPVDSLPPVKKGHSRTTGKRKGPKPKGEPTMVARLVDTVAAILQTQNVILHELRNLATAVAMGAANASTGPDDFTRPGQEADCD